MTEQSPSDRVNRASNDIFEATSFLSGTNAQFLEALYAPVSGEPGFGRSGVAALISTAWANRGLTPPSSAAVPSWRRDQKVARPKDDLIGALTGEPAPVKAHLPKAHQPRAVKMPAPRAQDSIRAIQLVRAYRSHRPSRRPISIP